MAMAAKAYAGLKPLDTYIHQTIRPLHSLAFILPLLLFFHVGGAFCLADPLAPLDVNRYLRFLGGTIAYLPPLAIVVVLLAQHLVRRDPWRIRPVVLLGMGVEAVLHVIPLIVIGHLMHRLVAFRAAGGAASQPDAGVLRQLVEAAGAGIYEEFLFRLVAITLIMLLFVDVFGLPRGLIAVAAILICAVFFGLYHVGGEHYDRGSFIFRTMAGVYLGAVFLLRGFGVAVGSHVMWNVYVYMLT